MFLTHLRRNVVAYLALAIAVSTGTAYAAAAIPDGSVTAAKLHKNAVTSGKIKNGTIKPKDLKKPTYVQSVTLGADKPPAPTPDVVSVAPYNFTLPTKGRATVTVFIPALTTSCNGGHAVGRALHRHASHRRAPGRTCRAARRTPARSELTATLSLNGGAHAGQVGITCPGGGVPNPSSPGAETWTVVLTG